MSSTSGKTVAGRVLVIIAFIGTLLCALPLVLAAVLGFLTNDATGYAFVPFLLLVVIGLPVLLGGLVIAAILAIIGLILGGHRALGIITVILSVAGALGGFVWLYGVDAGWF